MIYLKLIQQIARFSYFTCTKGKIIDSLFRQMYKDNVSLREKNNLKPRSPQLIMVSRCNKKCYSGRLG